MSSQYGREGEGGLSTPAKRAGDPEARGARPGLAPHGRAGACVLSGAVWCHIQG